MDMHKAQVTFAGGCWYLNGHLIEPAYDVDNVVKYYVCIHYMVVFTIDDLNRFAIVDAA